VKEWQKFSKSFKRKLRKSGKNHFWQSETKTLKRIRKRKRKPARAN